MSGRYLCCPIPTSTLAVCLEIHRHYRESFRGTLRVSRTLPTISAMYLSQAVGRELLSPFGLFAVNAASNQRSMAPSAANDNGLILNGKIFIMINNSNGISLQI